MDFAIYDCLQFVHCCPFTCSFWSLPLLHIEHLAVVCSIAQDQGCTTRSVLTKKEEGRKGMGEGGRRGEGEERGRHVVMTSTLLEFVLVQREGEKKTAKEGRVQLNNTRLTHTHTLIVSLLLFWLFPLITIVITTIILLICIVIIMIIVTIIVIVVMLVVSQQGQQKGRSS